MKKLLILGGDHFAIPVVEAAKAQGYYVITCDYLPDNVAHKYSDEFANFSTTDKEGILAYAREKRIDGICTFTDSGVVTTAYVQHHLDLPQIGPLESVEILQNKDRFRAFLAKNGFNVPQAKGYSSVEDAMSESYWYPWPVIVKPTDSAGSKGVTRVDRLENLRPALEYAMQFSVSKHVIVEEFIEKDGCSSDSDCFSVDGQLVVTTFSAQRFDEKAENPYAPSAYTWPSTFGDQREKELHDDIQRLLKLLGMKTSVYNVETRIGRDGKAYIMEVSPRGGGNRLSEMVRFSTGADMITAAVRAAVGDEVSLVQNNLDGHWAEVILHSDKIGEFYNIEIASEYQKFVLETDLWVKEGDRVEKFSGANKAIGTLVLKFQSQELLENAICCLREWIHVLIR